MIAIRNFLVDGVARIPARVQTKLLVAFLTIVVLLILLGAVGWRVLSGMNERSDELIELQRKIAAYQQVQHDTTSQLYRIASALLSPDEQVLESVLRQLTQFGYDLDRLQHIAQSEIELFGRVRQDYDRFIEIINKEVAATASGPGALRSGHVQPRRSGLRTMRTMRTIFVTFCQAPRTICTRQGRR